MTPGSPLLLAASSALTMGQGVRLAYLLAAVLFILGLKQLSSPKSARKGNWTAAVGMVIAIAASPARSVSSTRPR